MKTTPRKALVVIVVAQFCCTSLWFAGNAVTGDLVTAFDLAAPALGHLTAAVQLGFISGTLLFALLTIADRFSPSRVFMVCAMAGALINLSVLFPSHHLVSLLAVRFSTGVLLAGIYPVGMKIASDYHEKGLGKALGYLVGALTLGTAFPHLIRSLSADLLWQSVFVATSLLSAAGGLGLYFLVPDGPYRRKSLRLDLAASFKVFKHRDFRSAAFGYFGHMWELYAFWAFVPLILSFYAQQNEVQNLDASLLSFLIIGSGGIGCVAGGYLAVKNGSRKTALAALMLSGCCCALSPFIYSFGPAAFFGVLFIWGLSVVADSPQFSTLVAQSAPKENTGTALTIVNCIGFSITIFSIEGISILHHSFPPSSIFLFLLPGPLFGIYAMLRK